MHCVAATRITLCEATTGVASRDARTAVVSCKARMGVASRDARAAVVSCKARTGVHSCPNGARGFSHAWSAAERVDSGASEDSTPKVVVDVENLSNARRRVRRQRVREERRRPPVKIAAIKVFGPSGVRHRLRGATQREPLSRGFAYSPSARALNALATTILPLRGEENALLATSIPPLRGEDKDALSPVDCSHSAASRPRQRYIARNRGSSMTPLMPTLAR